jgi:pentatricopeptide repeat protein
MSNARILSLRTALCHSKTSLRCRRAILALPPQRQFFFFIANHHHHHQFLAAATATAIRITPNFNHDPPSRRLAYFSTTSSSSSSSSPFLLLDNKEVDLKEAIGRFLDQNTFPLGSLDATTWLEMELLIQAGAELQSPAVVDDAFFLLDRLSEELLAISSSSSSSSSKLPQKDLLSSSSSSSSVLTTSLLNTLVDTWRKSRMEDHDTTASSTSSSSSLHPKDVLAKIVTYESRRWPTNNNSNHTFQPNVDTYAMILDVACHDHLVHVANMIWNHVVDRSKRNLLLSHPTTAMLQKVIQVWTNSERHDAAAKATQLLHTALEFKSLVELQDLVLMDNMEEVTSNSAEELNDLVLLMDPSITSTTTTTTATTPAVSNKPSQACQPNTSIYNTILECWAQTGNTPAECVEAAERAEALLRQFTNYHQQQLANNNKTINQSISESDNDDHAAAAANNCKPNAASYAAVIKAWSRSGHAKAPQRAQALFDEMNAIYKATGDLDMKPSQETYGPLMTTFVRSKQKGSAAKAHEIFQEMQQQDPLAAASVAVATTDRFQMAAALSEEYALSIVKWARAGHAEKAQEMLQQMVDAAKLNPSIHLYTAVMQAWCGKLPKEQPNAAERVQEVFDQAMKRYQDGHDEAKPDQVAYAVLIRAWSMTRAPHKAQAVLDQLIQQHKQGQIQFELRFAFRPVLEAWVQVGDLDRAEEVLQRMEEMNVTPFTKLYQTLLRGWLRALVSAAEKGDKAKVAQAVQRAQMLLDDLIQKYDNGEQDAKPNQIIYGLLISMWSRSGLDEAPLRVQAIFRDMSRRSNEDSADDTLKPTSHDYSSFLEALAKTGEVDAAEETLRNMEASGSAGASDYIRLLKGFCDRGDPEKAEQLLQQMLDANLNPNTSIFTSVMHAWSVQQNDAQRVQALFDIAVQRYEAGHLEAKPSEYMYATLIGAWGRSTEADGLQKAKAILDDLVQRHQRGEIDFAPDRYHYGPVLVSLSRAGQIDQVRAMLQQMKEQGVTADASIYGKLMTNCLAHQAKELSDGNTAAAIDAAHQAQALFDDLVGQYEAGAPLAKPTRQIYQALVRLWSRSKHRDRAVQIRDLFRDMLQRRREGVGNLEPSSQDYAYYLEALAKTGEAEEATAILRQMTRENMKVNASHYAPVLMALALSGNKGAAKLGQALFDAMIEKFDAGDQKCQPDSFAVFNMMTLWTQSNLTEGPHKAQAIFDEMLARSKAGQSELKPTAFMCSLLLEAWSRAGQVEQAKNILRQMVGQEVEKTNIKAFNSMISSCAKSGIPGAEEVAQTLFDEAVLRYEEGDKRFKPTAKTYDNLIGTWARIPGRKDGPIKAQAIFDHILPRIKLGEIEGELDPGLYSTLIESWCRVGEMERAEELLRAPHGDVELGTYTHLMKSWLQLDQPNSVEKAQGLFEEIIQEYEAGNPRLKPTLATYGTMINAWGKRGSKEGAAKAQALFSQLITRYKAGDEEFKPTTSEYNALLDAWARGGEVEKAEYIFRQINDSKGPVKASFVTLAIVLEAWFRSGRPDGPDRGQALLDEVIQKGKTKRSFKLARTCFTTVLTGWALSGRKDGAVKAQAVFDEMMSLYNDGELEEQAGLKEYNLVLIAWAKIGEAAKAEALLEEMCSANSIVSPDKRSFSAVISAWSRSGDQAAGEKAESWLRKMQSTKDPRCQPDKITYTNVIQTWSKSTDPSALERAEALLQEMIEGYSSGHGGLAPNSLTFMFYFQTLDRSNVPDKAARARKTEDFMKKQGIEPDERILWILKRIQKMVDQ